MPHPLTVRINALRRKSRTLLLVHGASCALAVGLTLAVVAALGDYLLRYEEPGIRWASTICVAAVLGWAVWRYWLPAVRFPLSDIFLARQIERKFPELHERLAGAVAFLNEPAEAPGAGSAQLRRTVIHETTEDALRLPTFDILRSRPVWLAFGTALVVVAATAALGVAHQEAARIAAARLLKPWGDDAWPQTNRLKFVDPARRIAYGHRFLAEVVDESGQELAGDVVLLTRRLDDDSPIERTVMRFEGGSWSAERAKVTHDFAYRAVGGDDRSMPWRELKVVEPPLVQEIQWEATYPAYVDWKPLDTGPRPGDQNVLASSFPAGIVLEARGRTNKPLKSATLQLDGDEKLAATLSDDRLGFSLAVESGNAWKPLRSSTYRWELVGDDGFTGGDELRRELVVEADAPPWVKLPLPQATPEDPRGDIVVTPQAVVKVQIQAGDAFTVRPGTALREVVLRYNRSDRSAEGDQNLPVHAGPAKLEPPIAPAPATLRDEETRTFDYAWELKPLELPPGTIVTLFAAASDYLPQERTSESRRLRIVGPEEFLERMNDRQRALHAELNKLRTKQATAQERTSNVEREAAAPPRDDKAAEEQRRALADALDLQRDVAAGLGLSRKPEQTNDPKSKQAEGVKGRIESMLADMRDNRIDNREVESRLADMAAELTTAEQDAKPHEIADRVAEALKADARDDKQRQEAQNALRQADEGQQKMLAALDAMLENLSQWDDYGKFHEELSRVKRDQEQLAAETTEQLRKQLTNEGKPTETTEERQAAAAGKREELAERQAAAARKFEQLQQDMRRNLQVGQQQSGAEALERALKAAEQSNPAADMRDAGQMLRGDQLGKAPEKQQAALEKLGEVMKALNTQKLDELNRLVSKLKAAESELDKLAKEQRGLQKKFKDAQQMPEGQQKKQELQKLAREQRDVQKRTEQMAEQLKRLKAQRSAGRTSQGGQKMSGAGKAGEQGDADTAEDNADAAARDLENAQQELAEERKQAEQDLAREASAKLQDDLKAFIARQQRVVDEIKRYEALRQAGTLTRGAQIGILDLAEEQAGLEKETRDTAERLGSAAAFKLALEGAAAEMELTAQSLRERKTDGRTQRTAENAIRRYQHLLDALKPRKGSGKGEGGQGGGGGQGQGGQQGGGSDMPTSLAELVLIKIMQEDVNARTRQLDGERKRQGLAPEESAELRRLGEEQGKLADLLLELVGDDGGDGGGNDDAEQKDSPELTPDDLDAKKKPKSGAIKLDGDLDLDLELPKSKPAQKPPAENPARGDT
jgi:hypothetical protein